MSQPADEAREEIVSQEIAHEEFVQQHRHDANDRPDILDDETLKRLEHSG